MKKNFNRIIASANINLDKIDEDNIVFGKDGTRWLNISMFLKSDKNKYGYDIDIQQTLTAEERANGFKARYIGNGVIKHVK